MTPQEKLQIDHEQFMAYLHNSRNYFLHKILEIAPNGPEPDTLMDRTRLRFAASEIIIAYDQVCAKYDAMKKALLSVSTTGL